MRISFPTLDFRCTLFKSSRRIRRHLINGGDSVPQKRREAAQFVEVCTDGCEGNGCVNLAYSSQPQFPALLLIASAFAVSKILDFPFSLMVFV